MLFPWDTIGVLFTSLFFLFSDRISEKICSTKGALNVFKEILDYIFFFCWMSVALSTVLDILDIQTIMRGDDIFYIIFFVCKIRISITFLFFLLFLITAKEKDAEMLIEVLGLISGPFIMFALVGLFPFSMLLLIPATLIMITGSYFLLEKMSPMKSVAS